MGVGRDCKAENVYLSMTNNRSSANHEHDGQRSMLYPMI